MRTQIIACKTLEQELQLAMQRTGISYPIHWLPYGLHNTPKQLRETVSSLLQNTDGDRVLLAMSFCGNALEGLQNGAGELIVPRADDCISLLMGSAEKKREFAVSYGAYFLTEGWMAGERNIWTEHLHAVERYGTEKAMKIANLLYGHYRTLALLDAGCGRQDLVQKTSIIAETFGLEQIRLHGTTSWLEELLTGPWKSERFLVLRPNDKISLSDLSLSLEKA